MSDREAMKEALRLLTKCAGVSRLWQVTDACDILRARLAAPSEDIETLRRDAERLRGLLAEAQKAVWMNYDGDLLDRIEAALKEVPR